MDLLNDTLRIWAQYREYQAVLADLNSRSDAELAKLGLERGDVARVAYKEAERRIATPSVNDAERPVSPGRAPSFPVLGRYRVRPA